MPTSCTGGASSPVSAVPGAALNRPSSSDCRFLRRPAPCAPTAAPTDVTRWSCSAARWRYIAADQRSGGLAAAWTRRAPALIGSIPSGWPSRPLDAARRHRDRTGRASLRSSARRGPHHAYPARQRSRQPPPGAELRPTASALTARSARAAPGQVRTARSIRAATAEPHPRPHAIDALRCWACPGSASVKTGVITLLQLTRSCAIAA